MGASIELAKGGSAQYENVTSFSGFMVLAGSAEPQENQLRYLTVRVNWPIFVVIRNRLIRNFTTNGTVPGRTLWEAARHSRIWIDLSCLRPKATCTRSGRHFEAPRPFKTPDLKIDILQTGPVAQPDRAAVS